MRFGIAIVSATSTGRATPCIIQSAEPSAQLEKLIPVAITALDIHLASIDLLVVIAVCIAGRAGTVTNARGASDCSHIVVTAGHATGSAASPN